ncbi:hypothetical protein NA78x_004636 [Anatilimnocola sp. NA78]|uniref:hypothetical protein n=1 Tax=Anatilimnocola sp. NA78 TaxID=3415683 RepID=UPI003CE4E1B5
MARECPRCGDELMGAVNRCWKCGLDLRAATQPTTPRTSATSHEPIIVAELAAEPQSASPTERLSPTPPAAPVVAPSSTAPVEFLIDGTTRRRGSPFTPGALLLPPPSAPTFGQPTKPQAVVSLQQSYASNGGAVAAIVLGLFGLIIAPLRFEGAIVGVVGLIMGIWGLYSRRRGWALFGLILCCLAIGIGCYTGAIWLYQTINNSNPWDYS